MNQLLTIKHLSGRPEHLGAPTAWNHTADLCRKLHQPDPPPTGLVAGEINAYVNHGRWVADCPCCSGAMIVDPADPFFFCPECRMQGKGWYYVEFPADLLTIERLLTARPDIHTRNWRPGETMDRLSLENRSHGIEVTL